MSVLTDAIYNRLVGDSYLMTLITQVGSGFYYDPVLGQYVSNSKPAVYTYEIPFDQFQNPDYAPLKGFIVTTGHVSDATDGKYSSKTKKARSIVRDIRCYYRMDNDPNTPDTTFKQVEAIAERVYELFHRQTFTIPDPTGAEVGKVSKWNLVTCEANGPIFIPNENAKVFDKNIDMMVVSVRFTVQEKP